MIRNICTTIILILSIGVLFSTCGKDKINIKSFYYPIDALKSPLVYEYQAVNNDSLGAQYLYFSTHLTDTATYFTTNIYNNYFEVEQFSVEEVVSNGMLQKDYFLYSIDTAGIQTRLPATIEYGNTFPFKVKDSAGVFLQKMKWTFSEVPLHTTTLIRNRRYIGDTKYEYQGKSYDAIVFSMREVIDDFYDGHLETEASSIEIYAKDIGLVYYKKTIGEGLVLEYELKDTYEMKVLEEKFGQR